MVKNVWALCLVSLHGGIKTLKRLRNPYFDTNTIKTDNLFTTQANTGSRLGKWQPYCFHIVDNELFRKYSSREFLLNLMFVSQSERSECFFCINIVL